MRSGKFDDRLFKKNVKGRYIAGGIHLTSNAFLPTAILKELTATEDDIYNGFINLEYMLSMSLSDMALEQKWLYTQYYRPMWAEAMDPVEIVDDDELYIPWFLDCNRERFPYWFGKEDPRNQNLLNRMKEVKHSFHFPEQKKKASHLFSRIYLTDPNNRANFISKPAN